MTAYVSITRRFALAKKEELRDPDYLSYFGSEPDGVYKWPDLFEMTPLIILGEGRSGKTREFEEQIDLLHKSGIYAFFLPLERLHDESLESALSTKDLKAFKAWTESPTAVAYFFLDALDELKLREGSLRTAVKKLQLACEPHFARMASLDEAHPQAVADVVAGEALAQLQQLSDVGQAEMFHDVLYHGTENMKAALAARIAPHISGFLSAKQDGAKNALEYAIRIIAEDGTSVSCALAIASLQQQLEQDASLSAL